MNKIIPNPNGIPGTVGEVFKIGTTFSGIGAPEQALKNLTLLEMGVQFCAKAQS